MNPPYKRLLFLLTAIFFGFSAVLFQYFKIQVLEGKTWRETADRQHYFTVQIPAKRGSIYSSTSFSPVVPFSLDLEVFDLFADPKMIPSEKKEEIVLSLSSLLNLSEGEIFNLRTQLGKKSRRRKLVFWLENSQKDLIFSWWTNFAKENKLPKHGLFFETSYRRTHPLDSLLGQVLHTVQHQRDEKTMRSLPTGGLELTFHKLLEGSIGKKRYLRSPLNTFDTGEMISPPERGADIYLTIHPLIQQIAEEEIELGVKRAGAKRGWAILMDPSTGKILALAQYPSFSPSLYPSHFSSPGKIEETRVKAIQDAQEPGSVMKPFTLAVALIANKERSQEKKKPIFDPDEKIETSKGMFPGRSKPVEDTRVHSFLNMWLALQKSSNIYMAHLASRIVKEMGEDWYRDVLIQKFGFGEKTGIELPSESAGLVPKPGKLHPNGALEWSKGTPYSLAMGHNILATGIQLTRALSVFANGGYLVNPTLIEKIIHRGSILVDNSHITLHPSQKVLDEEIVHLVNQAMRLTTKPGGTARKADIPGFTEAGKTSTPKKIIDGHYSERLYLPSFIGFAPVQNPAFVCLVAIDEPKYGFIPGKGLNHHGGTSAAPVFQRIGKRTLPILGRIPDDPFGYPEGDPRRDPGKGDLAQRLLQLERLYNDWNSPKY